MGQRPMEIESNFPVKVSTTSSVTYLFHLPLQLGLKGAVVGVCVWRGWGKRWGVCPEGASLRSHRRNGSSRGSGSGNS